jgi:manganese transport protein
MEGFLNWRIEPWLRRLITRGLAIIPALLLVGSSGGSKTAELITITQVVLSMQLPFAIFPLVMFTSDKKRMGSFASPVWLQVLAYAICVAITSLNIKYLWDTFGPVAVLVGAGIIAAFSAWVIFFVKSKKPDEPELITQVQG